MLSIIVAMFQSPGLKGFQYAATLVTVKKQLGQLHLDT